ncbi:MAG: hypothetical protein KBD19_01100 [Candidatus Moranbacteria bacterium]|nr:hypothetical protein [Candidatus Moranbacteria bacterium]
MKPIISTIFLLSILILIPVRNVSASGSLSPWAEDAVNLMNQERAERGLPGFTVNGTLAKAAQAKLSDMEKKNYFAHTSPEKLTPWSFIEAAGYDYRFAGENLAIHFKNPKSEHDAWMKSEKHCQNILDPRFREVGMAVGKVFFEGRETMLVVSMFGAKAGEDVDPLATKEQALSMCRGEEPVVSGAVSDEPSDGSEGRIALFMKSISVKFVPVGEMWNLIIKSPYDAAQLFATAMFAGAQMSAIVLVSGVVLSRERREGLFPS